MSEKIDYRKLLEQSKEYKSPVRKTEAQIHNELSLANPDIKIPKSDSIVFYENISEAPIDLKSITPIGAGIKYQNQFQSKTYVMYHTIRPSDGKSILHLIEE